LLGCWALALCGRSFAALNPANQSRECAARAPDLNPALVKFFRARKMQSLRRNQFRLNLKQRSARLAEKLAPLAIRETPLTFGNLCRHAHRRATHLRHQAELLM